VHVPKGQGKAHYPVHRLVFCCTVPPEIGDEHVIGRNEIQAHATAEKAIRVREIYREKRMKVIGLDATGDV
jgi:hypothetical protein